MNNNLIRVMAKQTENEKQGVTMAIMATDIGYIKKSIENIEGTLASLDDNYAKKTDIQTIERDHEMRLRRLETWGFTAVGALAVIQFALNYFK